MRTRCLTLAASILALMACAGTGDAQTALVPTPPQSEGPFYPRPVPAETDNDLFRITTAPRDASGDPILLVGRVLRADGQPVGGATVEIWQTDSRGIYLHPNEPRLRDRDPNFQGYGRMTTDATGRYSFRTVRPVPYDRRTAHIHVRVHPPGGAPALTTQVYFPDEAENARDVLLRRVQDPRQREALMVRLVSGLYGMPRAEIDIVLR